MPQGENFWNPYRMIPTRDNVQRRAPLSHERFCGEGRSGKISCTLTNLTPLFISKTNKGDPRMFQNLEHNNKPVIPGTSLKGMLRSLAEIVGGGCFVTNNQHKCQDAFSLCIACRMFGMTGNTGVHMGSVSFSDAIFLEDMPDIQLVKVYLGAPNPDHYSFYVTPQTGNNDGNCRKFYFHQPRVNNNFPRAVDAAWNVSALVAGHHFSFDITFSNLRDEEIRLLVYILALEENVSVTLEEGDISLSGPLRHKIGNAKPFGMGSCHITIDKISYLPGAAERFRTLEPTGVRTLEGDILQTEIDALKGNYVNDTTVTMQQLRKMMVWDESDSRTFRYPDYHWFNTPGNSERNLKHI